MIFFHRTTVEAARSIITEYKFRDSYGYYLIKEETHGVWISNIPLTGNEGAKGEVVLKIQMDIDEQEIKQYEYIEKGKPYREWQIPAVILNNKMELSVYEFNNLATIKKNANDADKKQLILIMKQINNGERDVSCPICKKTLKVSVPEPDSDDDCCAYCQNLCFGFSF